MDDEVSVQCPFCYEEQLLVVDPGTEGSFVQDCDVCCRPWQVHVSRSESGELEVTVERGN
ncbi:MAG: CPXCG motif-containing cysteine-rich protein [Polyangiales bacterium]|nr:CPXCG motif-containing cysteine-rich protein [Myxococcales bacterium]